MINAIFYPIFIRSNGTSNMTGQDFVCFLLALMVLGVFMLIGSLIYSMIKAKTSTYWGFNWHDIKTLWCDTFCYIIGWICIILPIIFMFLVFLIHYIKQILF
jgi:hypothetical protein